MARRTLSAALTTVATAALLWAGCMMGPPDEEGMEQSEQAMILQEAEGGGGGGGGGTSGTYAETRSEHFKRVWNVRRGKFGYSDLNKHYCVRPGLTYRVSWTDRYGDWWTGDVKVSIKDGECIGMRGPGCSWDGRSNYSIQTVIHDACCHQFGEEGTSYFNAPNCHDEFGPEFPDYGCKLSRYTGIPYDDWPVINWE